MLMNQVQAAFNQNNDPVKDLSHVPLILCTRCEIERITDEIERKPQVHFINWGLENKKVLNVIIRDVKRKMQRQLIENMLNDGNNRHSIDLSRCDLHEDSENDFLEFLANGLESKTTIREVRLPWPWNMTLYGSDSGEGFERFGESAQILRKIDFYLRRNKNI